MFGLNRKKLAPVNVQDDASVEIPVFNEPELPSPPPVPMVKEKAPVVHSFPVNPVERHSSKSFFVSDRVHQSVMSNIALINNLINGILPENTVNPVEAKEKSEIDEIRLALEDIERKLVYVDKLLFGG